VKKCIYVQNGYGAFSDKGWKLGSIGSFLKRIRTTGTMSDNQAAPRSACSDDNIEKVEDLVLSQKDNHKTHWSTREISCETGIPRSSVHMIIHRDLYLNCFKRRRSKLHVLRIPVNI